MFVTSKSFLLTTVFQNLTVNISITQSECYISLKLFISFNTGITTVSLLVIVALFMTAKNYSGDQIQCNGDLSKLSVTQSYVNSICWVKEIYQVNYYESFFIIQTYSGGTEHGNSVKIT